METQFDTTSSRIITSPLEPWWDVPDSRDNLTKLVTSNAPTVDKITALARFLQLTGQSSQSDQWEKLLQIAAIDIGVARMLEPHVDALGILAEAGHEAPDPHSAWGVYAADLPTHHVTATEDGAQTVLIGEKAWCSLATELSHAIVIAGDSHGNRACAVNLRDPRVRPQTSAWPSLGLKEIPSGSVAFDRALATSVGPPNWYLDRPSFAWGGIRVAACWFGGALGMARSAAQVHLRRTGASPMGEMQLGQLDAEVFAVRTVLSQAATAADGDEKFLRAQAWRLALRVRNTVYRSVQRIQLLSRELAGPAALTGDAAFAKADADLTVYLTQHHGPRDEAALGENICAESDPDEL
ncbi:hypothetical protein [Brevibacterium marinum]|uniref:Alkylation response protein AidB-like acyl-CoA dehydrogenase n=1 Tax=Brevibacterium marinum TaxID=418643 RepID=A0A846S789_9MICO|nr:hypothetical protein [Brevibacterium marinum]NJC57272.1 alkylation response protein AidB-like acyl-CoA dehydrogenase [Brevibacterium marinum]